jgi:hypothetical protein
MKVQYIGPYADGVYVPAADAECKPGDTIEVSDELGASLLEQTTNWRAVPAAKSKTTTAEEG